MKKAGERDVNKIIGLIKEQLKRLTAKDVGALPETGGTISGNANPLLTIKRIFNEGSVSIKLIPGNGKKGGVLVQSNYREVGNQFLIIRQNEVNQNLNLFLVSETQRQIHDYKTGTLKEILVKGEATPVGMVYTSINNTNPALMCGGTWESMGTEEKAGTTCYLWKRTS